MFMWVTIAGDAQTITVRYNTSPLGVQDGMSGTMVKPNPTESRGVNLAVPNQPGGICGLQLSI